MLKGRAKVKQKARKPEQAFKQMKQLIAKLPLLTAPMEKEELIVYMAATKETERGGKPTLRVAQRAKQKWRFRAEDIGKLGPKWEGTYKVTEALGKGAYKLRDRDGKQLPRTWKSTTSRNVIFTKCKQLTHAGSANAHHYTWCWLLGWKTIPSPTFFDMEANSTSFGELKTVSAMNPSSKSGRDDDKEAQSPIMPMKKSFVNVVVDTKSVPKNKFANSIFGYFVGKTIAFILVKNYVVNTWGKYGFQKIIKDDDGFYFFKFASKTGVDQVLEQGPWMIRHTPIILTKWSANMSLTKDKVTEVPVWVKMHKVPVVAYYEDGLSLIATQQCPKRVIQEQQVNKQEKEVEEDGFTSVSHKRKKGKQHTNTNQKQSDGLKMNKPKVRVVWQKTNQIAHKPDKEASDMDDTNMDPSTGCDSDTPSAGPDKEDNWFASRITRLNIIDQKGSYALPYIEVPPMYNVAALLLLLGGTLTWSSGLIGFCAPPLPNMTFKIGHRGLLGDFNAALNLDDKSMGSSNFDISMREFKECVEDIEVSDCVVFDIVVVEKLKHLKKPLRKLLYDQGVFFQNATIVFVTVYVKACNDALLMEEHFLKHKAKIDWLRVEDSNSAYFHKVVKGRVHQNRIDAAMNADGLVVTRDQVPLAFEAHFSSFLGQQGVNQALNFDNLFINTLDSHVASYMICAVSTHEVKEAVFEMGNDKSPGPDGYTTAFFKEAWDVVSTDITKPCKNSLLMVLFRRSKILPNRIKDSLSGLVSPNQSAFIPGRRITDNILLTQEIMHNYHLNRGSLRCAFKVDIQKAYDTFDWKFLREILCGFGFHPRTVIWIMECVSSTSFSLNINGTLHGYFKGKRGLRQSDPCHTPPRRKHEA
ncbi:polypyrimidine tract-binding protein homolog 2 isoform X1 [Tanacetum coccineum]